MSWSYKRTERDFAIPVGKYRIRIRAAEKAVSKNGNDMLALQFDVSGSASILYHYIVFLDDRPEITNRNLTQFFDAFPAIAEGDFDMRKWIGKMGACTVVVDKNDDSKTRLGYFIPASRQDELPPWKEVGTPATHGVMTPAEPDDDFPF